MATRRHLELHLLRLLPHPLRDDFVTIGLALVEEDGGFADVRMTRDLRMLQCVAPDLELEWIEVIEREIRGRLASLRRREDFVALVAERFGTILDVAPTKAVVTEDPAKEMEVLTGMYLMPLRRGESERAPTGRVAIVRAMEAGFEQAGVLGLMQRDLDLGKYTGAGDPFRFDFGYRIGDRLKMLHAVTLKTDPDHVLGLAFRFSRISAGMERERLRASLTAVVDQAGQVVEEKMRFAVGMLEQNQVRVRAASEVEEIAAEVRRELAG